MITINYKQEPYDYEDVGGQNYKVEMNIEMNEDASPADILDAIVRVMQAATYNINAKTLCEFVENWAYEHGQDEDLRCSI